MQTLVFQPDHLFAIQAIRPGAARHLLAGQWAVASAEAGHGPLRTLLGSCVAVALWHRSAGVAALCHAVLPSRKAAPASGLRSHTASASASAAEGHFLDEALPLMLDALRARGLNPRDCDTSLVGGASLLAAFAPARPGAVPVGQQNADLARRLAQQHGLRVVQQALGGVQPRQMSLDARCGSVVVRALPAPRPSLGGGHMRLS